ncbi:cysteine protease StiP family protein [Iodobacter fluviatilis]|uniref:Citrate lyase beta subunit n=1 Tax=Iodobacter fluviatilis TaxID=537 RepID=A0A377Q2M9_9NEIS|nr:cysteine protease StiP family protein [Iodobacter fluviatilis]TCU90008.1 RNA binding Pelota-like protein [Iodobacter fluviatilis]STQ89035.1 Citrate lyase beta subunit [Iodobacter fluviatilis]
MNNRGFCGSYRPDDVRFLLKRLSQQPFIDVANKELLIQSGARHYSEMLSPESLPSPRYLQVFKDALAANRQQMAGDCLRLAALIAARRSGPITLVSLVRAGTPVGVILKHLLQRVLGREVAHYSVSIIRDRGIDIVALQHILKQGHKPESIVFIDGWTGKGVISHVLEQAVNAFNLQHGLAIDHGLYVLSDLAGTAACAASAEDYLIPSSILNATVSGLVSRSVLNDLIGPDDFHGCVYYDEFESQDQSQVFADGLVADAIRLAAEHGVPAAVAIDRINMARISADFLQTTQERYGIEDVNLIKPGIGEATRVLLRRVPRLLILRDPAVADVAHLKLLAIEKNVPLIVDAGLPYQAVSLIGSVLDG